MNQTQISVNHRQIGYRIKEVREQNHISQAQLAGRPDDGILRFREIYRHSLQRHTLHPGLHRRATAP